jgi:hypothetical protein
MGSQTAGLPQLPLAHDTLVVVSQRRNARSLSVGQRASVMLVVPLQGPSQPFAVPCTWREVGMHLGQLFAVTLDLTLDSESTRQRLGASAVMSQPIGARSGTFGRTKIGFQSSATALTHTAARRAGRSSDHRRKARMGYRHGGRDGVVRHARHLGHFWYGRAPARRPP